MTLIGLTGSFCTGKTTVSAFFKDLGAKVIDADRIVHRLYRKDKGIKTAILENFGKEAFYRGKVDRKKLGRIIFGDKRNLDKLCRIIHPKVTREIKEVTETSEKAACVIDAPLLIESGLHRYVDYVVVVRASLDKQIERCAKNGFTKEDLFSRSAAQLPLSVKVKIADFVIDNNFSKKYTRNEVNKIWKKIFGR